MNIHTLSPVVKRSHKRVGRGHGSGRGKTAGRGTKGQNARGTMPPHFEGGQLSVMKRLPLLRGKGRNKSRQAKPTIVSTGSLSSLPAKTEVTLATLKKHGIVSEETQQVKVLVSGPLTVALTVHVACSKSAIRAIEKAGGTVGQE